MTQINKDTIQFHCQQLQETLIKKNHDYGNSVQDQFNEYGLTSILIRLDDKMRRLKNLRTLTPHVAEESLKDTLQDLAGYALLGLMCLVHSEEGFKPSKFPIIEKDGVLLLNRKAPYEDLDD